MKKLIMSLIILGTLATLCGAAPKPKPTPTPKPIVGIPITYLPYTISAPGTYVLTTDLSWVPVSMGAQITMNQQAVGSIVLDLNGHTFSSDGHRLGIAIVGNPSATAGALVIENGTIKDMGIAIEANDTQSGGGIKIQNVTFSTNIATDNAASGIVITDVRGATITGCRFIGLMDYAIIDTNSSGGNTYTNLSFDGLQKSAILFRTWHPVVLDQIHFLP